MKLLISVVAVTLILSSSLVQQSSAQNSECMQRLLPCMNYLNGTGNPPRSCCDPLKYLIKSEPECLCQMMSVNGANQAERAGINLTDAQQLPGKCGEHIDPLGCILGSPSSRSAGFSFKDPSRVLIAASWIIIPISWTFFNIF